MGDFLGLGEMSDASLETVKLIYPDLAQPGTKKVGQALETVLDLCNTILLPIKLLNSNANVFFHHHMEKYRKKMEKIQEKEIAVVPPTLGLKILDELLLVTNDDIADLFINLLTNASTISGVRYAHPSFFEVIKNLSEDEAKIINDVFLKGKQVKYVYMAKLDNGTVPLTEKKNDVTFLTNLNFEENSVFYMENLVKLGILEDSPTFLKDEQSSYDSLVSNFAELKNNYSDIIKGEQEKGNMDQKVKLRFYKGRYRLNSFGKKFIESISTKGF